MAIRLNKVRLAFPNLTEAKAFETGGKPYYSATILIEPGSESHKALEAAYARVGEAKWPGKFAQLVKTFSEDKRGLRDGSDKEYDGFAGMLFVSATNADQPLLITQDKRELASATRPAEPGAKAMFYAGCYVNVLLEPWAQDNKFGKALRTTLTGVQFHSDGDAFAGGAPARPDQFDDISVGATASAFL